jgi:hypothetical protein
VLDVPTALDRRETDPPDMHLTTMPWPQRRPGTLPRRRLERKHFENNTDSPNGEFRADPAASMATWTS